MKIKPEHLETIKNAIAVYLETQGGAAAVVARYEAGNFPRSDRVRDLQTRFCFDIADAAGLTPFYCSTLYEYANDTHISTALKAVCPKVTKKY